jgi:type I restriction enzyme, R subunit
VDNARWQYRHDRDPREAIFDFKRRTLVHFAVDTWLDVTGSATGTGRMIDFLSAYHSREGETPDWLAERIRI